MRPWSAWLASLGLACACGAVIGCGGSETNDPDADAVANAGGGAPAPGGGPAPSPAPAPGQPGPGGPGPLAGMPPRGPGAMGRRGEMEGMPGGGQGQPQAPAQAAPATPPSPEASSTTGEMLALATGANTPSETNPAAAPAKTNAPGGPPMGPGGQQQAMMAMMRQQGGPGGSMRPGGPMGGPGQGAPGAGGPPRGKDFEGNEARPGINPGAPNGPAMPANQPGGTMAQQMARMAGQNPGGPGMAGGMAAMMRQGGMGAPGSNIPADTHDPHGAVQAFLNALKSKDKEALAEATALRSETEAANDKNREMFGKIVQGTISDSELDDLSNRFEGYAISGENQVKSTGKLSVVISKSIEGGGWYKTNVIVRKEKKGWGVLDVERPYLFKPMTGTGRRGSRTGR